MAKGRKPQTPKTQSTEETIAQLGERIGRASIQEDSSVAKLRGQLNDYKARYKQALSDLEEARNQLEVWDGIEHVPSEDRGWETAPRKTSKAGTGIIVMSDWHLEEKVDPRTVNGVNEFDLEIAQKRVKTAWDRSLLLLEAERKLTKIDHIVIALLGDFISGYIHDELEEGNQLSPTESIMLAGDLIHSGIQQVKREAKVKSIDVVTCIGNHGRTTKKRRVATAWQNSYEYLLYKHLASQYSQDPKVRWKVEEGYHNWLNIRGRDVRFHHGDNIRYSGGVGGITIPVNKAIAQWDKTRTSFYDIFGHYHQWKEDYGWLCNGSLIGYNAFALSIKAEFQPPFQSWVVMDADRGIVNARRIFCE